MMVKMTASSLSLNVSSISHIFSSILHIFLSLLFTKEILFLFSICLISSFPVKDLAQGKGSCVLLLDNLFISWQAVK